MKKLLLTLLFSLLLFAGEYITLDNGKTILLNPDGTWQEVKVVKKGNETIALKPDGTWEKVEEKSITDAKALKKSSNNAYLNDPLVKILMGKWEGDGVYYDISENEALFEIEQGHNKNVIKGKLIIEKVDPTNKIVTLNIGEGARLGFLSFGGDIRKIKIVDNNTIIDITEKLSGKTYKLHKTGSYIKKNEKEEEKEGLFSKMKKKVKSWIE